MGFENNSFNTIGKKDGASPKSNYKRVAEKVPEIQRVPVEINSNKKLIGVGIFLFAIFIAGFFYFSYEGYFTPKYETTQTVDISPDNTVNVDNEYSFNPLTNNTYDMIFNFYVDDILVATENSSAN